MSLPNLWPSVAAALGTPGGLTLRTRSGGAWDDATGRFLGAVDVDVTLPNTVFTPLDSAQILQLPENVRGDEMIEVFVDVAVIATSPEAQTLGTRFVDGTTIYETTMIDDMERNGGVVRYVARRLGDG